MCRVYLTHTQIFDSVDFIQKSEKKVCIHVWLKASPELFEQLNYDIDTSDMCLTWVQQVFYKHSAKKNYLFKENKSPELKYTVVYLIGSANIWITDKLSSCRSKYLQTWVFHWKFNILINHNLNSLHNFRV